MKTALDRLNDVRDRIDKFSIQPIDSFQYFTTTIASLSDLVLESGVSTRDPVAERTFLALFALMQAKERAGQERATGSQGFAAGKFEQSAFDRFRHLRNEEESFFNIFDSYASEHQRQLLAATRADPATLEVNRLRLIALAGGLDGHLENVSGPTWFKAATQRIDLFRNVETTIADQAEMTAKSQAAAALRQFRVLIAGLLAIVGTITWLSVRTARRLARPIRQMTGAMVDLAAGNHDVVIPYTDRRDEIGAMAKAVEVFRSNATIRRKRENEIAHMARHDALTDLPNRTTFQERLERAVERAKSGTEGAVLFIDLDNFKLTNDTLGHFAGDQLLRIVAQRLQACIGPADLVARLGGDEFAIIQTSMKDVDSVRTLADHVLHKIEVPVMIEDQLVRPKASIGIALTPLDGIDSVKVLKNADLALYKAKADGGHCWCFFEASMEMRFQIRRTLEEDLHAALEQNQFVLYHQPLIDARTNEVAGFEALVRWMHPVRGLVSPAEFIPVAEETGLIIRLGNWVIDQACADAATWPDALSVAVNISPIQFTDPLLVETIVNALGKHALSPSRLEVEITESVLLLDDPKTLGVLHELRALGVRISMDDFGTGYSSLSYLRSFPFDKIKIDRSFISGLGVSDSAGAIIQAIATLGQSLGMAITAEGVETFDQLEMVKNQGCTQLQGYLFSAPAPSQDILKVIENLKHRQQKSAA